MSAFVHPWFLMGLAGAALPIIIHLLTRDRVRKVAFSTLRFFMQGARVTLRRKRWTEMVLIALRMLVCVLAALAFARPLLRARHGADGRTSYPQARVILADVSASIARSGGATVLTEAAKAAVNELPADAAVALYACDQTVQERAPLADHPAAAIAAAELLAPGEGGTDLAAALKQADSVLASVNAPKKDIVLISDFPKGGMDAYRGDWKLAPGVVLHPVSLAAASSATDVGIAGGEAPSSLVRDGQPRAISVRLINRGSNDLASVTAVLRLNGRDTDRQTVRLPPGETLALRFRHLFDKAGDNPGEVALLTEDADTADNHFYFNARVIPEIQVLLAAPEPDTAGSAAFFLRQALVPGPGSPFSVRTKAVSALRATDIDGAAVLILSDVGTVSQEIAAAVTRLLNRGGGVLFLPGDHVTPEAFWNTWSSIAPCRLRRILTHRSPQGLPEGAFGKLDMTHPVMEIFQRPHHGDFSTVRLARYWDVSESQASRVFARYADGRPALLDRTVGEGLVTLWLSPPDPTWNNLPLRAIFLPLLHETLRQAAVRTEWDTGFTVGQNPPPPSGYAWREEADRQAAAGTGAFKAGLHTLTNGEGQAVCYAFNRPFAEADPASLDPKELKATLERPEEPERPVIAGTSAAAGRGGRELWWWLAVSLALLLPAELAFANHTARH